VPVHCVFPRDRSKQLTHTRQARFACDRARGRKDTSAKQSFIFCEMARVWSRKHNRAGSGAAIIRRGGAALNHYKQAIFPHGRVIKSALARYGIRAI
jgi:hypothetical protein